MATTDADIDPLAAELPPGASMRRCAGCWGAVVSGARALQDVFAWPDRINTPSVVDDRNWTWRVPHPVDAWDDWPEAREAQARLLRETRAAGR